MRQFAKTLCMFLLITGSSCALAWADGGIVRWSQRQGGVELTVFTSPNPLRAGPIDVGVLVQDAATGEPIANADILVRLTPRDQPAAPLHAVASHAAATNKLLQAALVDLPAPGGWDVEVECTTAVAATTHTTVARFSLEAAPPFPRWLAVWPWFTWPLAAVLLFGIHRRLVARKQMAR